MLLFVISITRRSHFDRSFIITTRVLRHKHIGVDYVSRIADNELGKNNRKKKTNVEKRKTVRIIGHVYL